MTNYISDKLLVRINQFDSNIIQNENVKLLQYFLMDYIEVETNKKELDILSDHYTQLHIMILRTRFDTNFHRLSVGKT